MANTSSDLAHAEIEESGMAGKAFLGLPYRLYADKAAWRAPLRMERKAQLSHKNPAMQTITSRFFLVRRSGDVVGRIAAFTYGRYDAVHGGDTAFFGYFDCENDPAIADALLQAAKDWARVQGRMRLVGPAMWSVNEEVGLLVDGFDHPPAVMMPYGHPHQVASVKRNGFRKAIDLYAYRADLTDGAPKTKLVQNLRRFAERDEGLTWRTLGQDFIGDAKMALTIFNDAWSENWGFIPFSEDQFLHMAKEMKPIMFRDGFQIGFIDGVPASFIWMIPDVNELTYGFEGRLLPLNWVRLLWRLKTKQVTKGRVPLMGLKREFHKGRRGVALTTEICSCAFNAGKAQGIDQCELSWILEGNRSMSGICEMIGADLYKTYRMVEADL